jgi:hypothetical protein
MRSKCPWLLLTVVLCLGATSCVRIEIGDDKAEATVGQQLEDLADARRAGAVSESEFKQLRRKLLGGN